MRGDPAVTSAAVTSAAVKATAVQIVRLIFIILLSKHNSIEHKARRRIPECIFTMSTSRHSTCTRGQNRQITLWLLEG